ncbi:MAG: DUF4198 domain-containing protein [Rhodobacteraceae bacterium]|nr:DUF4198 domain-containing protein [Paracoccaceae bacterium]
MFLRPFLPVFIGLIANAGLAHEFWIDASEYQVEIGAPLLADLRNGEEFVGRELAYFPNRFTRFDLIVNGQTTALAGRLGDIPAVQTTATTDGLLVIAHQTKPKSLKYAAWEKFAEFAAHKDFTGVKAWHDARGLPESGFGEIYTRYAKALIGVGSAQGMDAQTGLETEFVALTNPYTDGTDSISIQLFYQGSPRTNTQIEVFDRDADAKVTITYIRTDDMGKAHIPVQAGHTYLLDAVVLRPAPEDDQAVWETLWAALTFGVPH